MSANFRTMSVREEVPHRDPLPVRVFRLGQEPSDDLSGSTSAEERFEMVAALSARMVEFSPTPPPVQAQRGIPVRVIRR